MNAVTVQTSKSPCHESHSKRHLGDQYDVKRAAQPPFGLLVPRYLFYALLSCSCLERKSALQYRGRTNGIALALSRHLLLRQPLEEMHRFSLRFGLMLYPYGIFALH